MLHLEITMTIKHEFEVNYIGFESKSDRMLHLEITMTVKHEKFL